MPIQTFGDQATDDVFNGRDTKKARGLLPAEVHASAQGKLTQIDRARDLRDLMTPGNKLHKLKGDREGQYAMRINDQWRIAFRWEEGNAHEVQIVDYH